MPSHTVVNKQKNVFLFIPNLIGYSRIILALASLHYMPYHPRTCSLLYSISCLLDALDGAAARHLDQSTRFGAVLDMITDRCTTTCLLVFLASAFPRWSIIFQGLISLDYSSHCTHMYATLVMGDKRSHKEVDERWPWALRIYYSNLKVLFIVCTLNELCLIALYPLSFSSSDSISSVEDWANKINSYWPWVLFSASLPFMLYKQYVNVVQLIQASKWIAQGDAEARQRDRLHRLSRRR
ncbi:CDP-alcohol phosphatidyltransferase-domain-containing protein [Aspergillus varians]